MNWTSFSEQWNVAGFVVNAADDLGERHKITRDESQGYRWMIEPDSTPIVSRGRGSPALPA